MFAGNKVRATHSSAGGFRLANRHKRNNTFARPTPTTTLSSIQPRPGTIQHAQIFQSRSPTTYDNDETTYTIGRSRGAGRPIVHKNLQQPVAYRQFQEDGRLRSSYTVEVKGIDGRPQPQKKRRPIREMKGMVAINSKLQYKGKQQVAVKQSYHLQQNCSKSLILSGAKGTKASRSRGANQTLLTKQGSPSKTTATDILIPTGPMAESRYSRPFSRHPVDFDEYVHPKAIGIRPNYPMATHALLQNNQPGMPKKSMESLERDRSSLRQTSHEFRPQYATTFQPSKIGVKQNLLSHPVSPQNQIASKRSQSGFDVQPKSQKPMQDPVRSKSPTIDGMASKDIVEKLANVSSIPSGCSPPSTRKNLVYGVTERPGTQAILEEGVPETRQSQGDQLSLNQGISRHNSRGMPRAQSAGFRPDSRISRKTSTKSVDPDLIRFYEAFQGQRAPSKLPVRPVGVDFHDDLVKLKHATHGMRKTLKKIEVDLNEKECRDALVRAAYDPLMAELGLEGSQEEPVNLRASYHNSINAPGKVSVMKKEAKSKAPTVSGSRDQSKENDTRPIQTSQGVFDRKSSQNSKAGARKESGHSEERTFDDGKAAPMKSRISSPKQLSSIPLSNTAEKPSVLEQAKQVYGSDVARNEVLSSQNNMKFEMSNQQVDTINVKSEDESPSAHLHHQNDPAFVASAYRDTQTKAKTLGAAVIGKDLSSIMKKTPQTSSKFDSPAMSGIRDFAKKSLTQAEAEFLLNQIQKFSEAGEDFPAVLLNNSRDFSQRDGTSPFKQGLNATEKFGTKDQYMSFLAQAAVAENASDQQDGSQERALPGMKKGAFEALLALADFKETPIDENDSINISAALDQSSPEKQLLKIALAGYTRGSWRSGQSITQNNQTRFKRTEVMEKKKYFRYPAPGSTTTDEKRKMKLSQVSRPQSSNLIRPISAVVPVNDSKDECMSQATEKQKQYIRISSEGTRPLLGSKAMYSTVLQRFALEQLLMDTATSGQLSLSKPLKEKAPAGDYTYNSETKEDLRSDSRLAYHPTVGGINNLGLSDCRDIQLSLSIAEAQRPNNVSQKIENFPKSVKQVIQKALENEKLHERPASPGFYTRLRARSSIVAKSSKSLKNRKQSEKEKREIKNQVLEAKWQVEEPIKVKVHLAQETSKEVLKTGGASPSRAKSSDRQEQSSTMMLGTRRLIGVSEEPSRQLKIEKSDSHKVTRPAQLQRRLIYSTQKVMAAIEDDDKQMSSLETSPIPIDYGGAIRRNELNLKSRQQDTLALKPEHITEEGHQSSSQNQTLKFRETTRLQSRHQSLKSGVKQQRRGSVSKKALTVSSAKASKGKEDQKRMTAPSQILIGKDGFQQATASAEWQPKEALTREPARFSNESKRSSLTSSRSQKTVQSSRQKFANKSIRQASGIQWRVEKPLKSSQATTHFKQPVSSSQGMHKVVSGGIERNGRSSNIVFSNQSLLKIIAPFQRAKPQMLVTSHPLHPRKIEVPFEYLVKHKSAVRRQRAKKKGGILSQENLEVKAVELAPAQVYRNLEHFHSNFSQ